MNCVLLPPFSQPDAATQINDNIKLSAYTLVNPNQVKHITSVLKATVGDTVKIGFKYGRLGTAVIKSIHPDRIELTQIHCQKPPPYKHELTMVVALCRPKVLRRLIIDMTAIGVGHIVLVNSYRTQKSYWQSPMLNRINEFIDEGLQQCVDTMPPKVSLCKRFKPFVEDHLAQWIQPKVSSESKSAIMPSKPAVVAHPSAKISLDSYIATQINQQSYLPQFICIGAEGGWIDYEVDMLEAHGCVPVSLGTRILRTEAVVNVVCGRYVGYNGD